MIDDGLVLRVERLRDSVEELRDSIRRRYKNRQRPVAADSVREIAAQVGERWLVEVAGRDDVRAVLGEETLADLNIHFQRLITYSERATARKNYEAAIRAILRDFRTRVVVPLKQHRGHPIALPGSERLSNIGHSEIPSSGVSFVAHSFAAADREVTETAVRFLQSYGYRVVTGEKPRATTVSQKVRDRIEQCDVFVGIFTRRERLSGTSEWVTSAWLIDEKAYALAKGKKLILLKEVGVQSIGGLQGDYEYLEFDRSKLADVLIRLLQLLRGGD